MHCPLLLHSSCTMLSVPAAPAGICPRWATDSLWIYFSDCRIVCFSGATGVRGRGDRACVKTFHWCHLIPGLSNVKPVLPFVMSYLCVRRVSAYRLFADVTSLKQWRAAPTNTAQKHGLFSVQSVQHQLCFDPLWSTSNLLFNVIWFSDTWKSRRSDSDWRYVLIKQLCESVRMLRTWIWCLQIQAILSGHAGCVPIRGLRSAVES